MVCFGWKESAIYSPSYAKRRKSTTKLAPRYLKTGQKRDHIQPQWVNMIFLYKNIISSTNDNIRMHGTHSKRSQLGYFSLFHFECTIVHSSSCQTREKRILYRHERIWHFSCMKLVIYTIHKTITYSECSKWNQMDNKNLFHGECTIVHSPSPLSFPLFFQWKSVQ